MLSKHNSATDHNSSNFLMGYYQHVSRPSQTSNFSQRYLATPLQSKKPLRSQHPLRQLAHRSKALRQSQSPNRQLQHSPPLSNPLHLRLPQRKPQPRRKLYQFQYYPQTQTNLTGTSSSSTSTQTTLHSTVFSQNAATS